LRTQSIVDPWSRVTPKRASVAAGYMKSQQRDYRRSAEARLVPYHVRRVEEATEHVNAKLMFEKASAINVEYDVMAMGASPGHDMPGMQMPGMQMPGR
jgi:copper(I)-binding protein